MKKKEFLTETKKKNILIEREKTIVNSFKKVFNKIKRLDEPKLVKENHEGLIDYDIPEWAMSALINGDYSGLYDEDEIKLNHFIKQVSNKYGNANFMLDDIEGEDNLGFKHSNDIDNLGSNVYRLYIKPSKIAQNDGEDYEKISREVQYGVKPYNNTNENNDEMSKLGNQNSISYVAPANFSREDIKNISFDETKHQANYVEQSDEDDVTHEVFFGENIKRAINALMHKK